MIIECPSCGTRYNIKADLPPEGRPVRCAKCGNVWRATAIDETFEAEPSPPGDEERGQAAEDREEDTAAATRADGHDATMNGYDGAAGTQDEPDPHSESFSGDGAPTDEASAADAEPQPAGGWSWQARIPGMAAPHPAETRVPDEAEDADERSRDDFGSEPAVPQTPAQPEAFEEPTGAQLGDHGGKVRWFGMFRRGRNGAQADGVSDAPLPPAANTIPFPAVSGLPPVAPGLTGNESFQTLDDARAAVRGVFANLGEGLREPRASTHVAPVLGDTTGQTEAGDSRSSPASWPTRPSPVPPPADEGRSGNVSWRQDRADTPTEISGDGFAQNGAAGGDGLDLPDRAYLRRGNRADIYGTPGQAGGAGWPEEGGEDLGERLARELQDKWRPASQQPPDETGEDDEAAARGIAGTLWQRPKVPLRGLDPQPADEPEAGVEPDPGLADPALEERLAREIEGRRLYRPVPEDGADEGRRGGLLVAAAWGLFLCAVAGVGVSFVSFRDAIADALPGAAPLYRAVGLPVTVQPLIFEDVTYNWTTAENGRPMLVLKGSIVNRANRKVPVPLLYVYVMDRDPAANREFRTLVQTDRTRLRRGEKAPFAIELLAPPPTITSVELEIRNIR